MVIGTRTFYYACSLRAIVPRIMTHQPSLHIALKAKSLREHSRDLKPGTTPNNSCQNSQRTLVQPSPRPHHIYISFSTLTNCVTFPHIFYGLPSACTGPTPVDRTAPPLPRAASHAHPPQSTTKSGNVDDGCTSARRRRTFHSDVMMMELALRDLMSASEPPRSSAL